MIRMFGTEIVPPFVSKTREIIAVVVLLAASTVHPAQAIIGGSEVNLTEQQQRGLVRVGGGCSGTLLSSDWVITAGHCVPSARPNPSVNVTAAWAPGAVFQSDAIYQFADVSQTSNPGPEFALIHLSRPVTGINPSYRMQIYSGSSASLVGKTVAKYGQGWSTLADANPATGGTTPSGGAGSYRAANLVVVSARQHTLMYEPNQASQILAPGDSGGPSIVWNQGTSYLVGITSTGAWDCFDNTGMTPAQVDANCRNSVFRVNQGHDISTPAVKAAVEAVLKTSWKASATSQPVSVYQPEIALTAFPIQDANTVHWAQATRLATKLCYNRGFSAGHFDGHQNLLPSRVADRTFGIHCSGIGTAWRDVTLAEIAATSWGFTDINAVPWAQANRAAERLCATAGQGFVGGHFTGHQANNRVGLFCYRDGAQWFDAPAQNIAGTQWAFTDVNAVPWAQAARAATDFCRGKGFGGGFFNGHQAPGVFGIVCQK